MIPLRSLSPRQRRSLFPVYLTVVDLLCICAGLLLTYWVRFHSGWITVVRSSYDPADYRRLFPISVLVFLAAFHFVHMYRRKQKAWSWRVARRLGKGILLATAIFATILFFFRDLTRYPLARWTLLLAIILVPLLVATARSLLQHQLVALSRMHGERLPRVLVIGAGPSAESIVDTIRRHPEFGWSVAGLVSPDPTHVGMVFSDLRVIGSLDDLPLLLQRERVEAVFVAQPDLRRERLGEIFVECQKHLVDIKVVPDTTELLFSQVMVETVDGIPFLGIPETPLQGWNIVLKRFLDVSSASFLLAMLAPIMAVIAFLIRRDSPGPVFYRQERVGADGRHFFITKFRTMREDAEKSTGPVFASHDDPRQTRVGRVLRQMHLDELPQLLNVLRGDMSLVGPRPERPCFVEQFREEIPRYMARHRIKSGMTGWAQVNGQTGHEGTIGERLKYDLFYIENWSPLFDLKVLLLTLFWLSRRFRQLLTLPSTHPSLRKPEVDQVDD